jgi:hypothetical protein
MPELELWVARFVAEVVVPGIKSSIPSIRKVIDSEVGTSEEWTDEQIGLEVLLAKVAIGLQPVRNLWDEETFERARIEALHILEKLGEIPEGRQIFEVGLAKYLSAYENCSLINMPWDEVSGTLLTSFAVRGSDAPGAIMNPIAIMQVSQVLMNPPVMFWKDLKEGKLKVGGESGCLVILAFLGSGLLAATGLVQVLLLVVANY